ncbi:MAG TPA: Rne/Rng family ribonuclease [Syntrophales bacterium]|nr:Rne/Rng family ribonuclease [Syntrophales bacterium]
MSKEMIINCSDHETRIAIRDSHVLSSLYIERADENTLAGNIYVGKVLRVLPGMQAAFVDIGLERAAFLHASDTSHDVSDLDFLVTEEGEILDREEESFDRKWYERVAGYQIEDLLKEGQEVLVQIAKEPLGTKGARVTTHISLPGRKLVLMPTVKHIGISRQIRDENERKRLKDLLEALQPEEGYGLIARTVSEGKNREELKADVEYLVRLWEAIRKKRGRVAVPGLVHKDMGMTLRAIRDFYTEEMDRIVIDSREEYQKVIDFMETFLPGVAYRLELHEGEIPLFDAFGMELDIKRILNRKVWLKSGGYITIEETEALTAIDVNTGKYVGKRNLEETILSTNLEAVKEIAYQLRVRNIGGIIIIDFIDMEDEENREKVFQALSEEMVKDKNRTNIQKISPLGLIEMTRQRKGKSLEKILCEPCPCCEGKGVLKSRASVCYEIFREIRRRVPGVEKKISVLLNPDVADFLLEDEKGTLEKLEKELNKKILIKVMPDFHQEHFEIVAAG